MQAAINLFDVARLCPLLISLIAPLSACTTSIDQPVSIDRSADDRLDPGIPATSDNLDSATDINEAPRFVPPPGAASAKLERVGNLTDPRASEVSGMAASGLSADRLWMVNDSGNSASLLAFSTKGDFQASVASGIDNRDWEALASFSLDNQAYLLVADTGDNLQSHAHYTLTVFAEPVLARESVTTATTTLQPVSQIRFVYPDGRHNCEAVAVSIADKTIILVTKSHSRPGIYSLPLRLENSKTVLTATRIGTLPSLPRTFTDELIARLVGVDLSQATALDINRQGNSAYLLTYRGIYRWIRHTPEQTWGELLSQQPEQLARHSLAQAEALAFSNSEDSVFVVSERIPSPILQLGW